MNTKVNHEINKRFFINLEGEKAEIEYRQEGDGVINFLHTFVPENFRGEGIAEQLVQEALEFARSHKLRVIPSCRFIASYIRRHEEYQDLIE